MNTHHSLNIASEPGRGDCRALGPTRLGVTEKTSIGTLLLATLGITLLAGRLTAGDAQIGPTAMQGEVVDASSGASVAARVYIQGTDGRWFFVKSASSQGTAVAYSKSRGPRCTEMHTTVSAHPFVVQLPPGRYNVRVERGTEYLAAERTVEIGGKSSTPEDSALPAGSTWRLPAGTRATRMCIARWTSCPICFWQKISTSPCR